MHTARFVDEKAVELKNKDIPLFEAAWKLALYCVGWPYIFGDRGQYCTPAHRRAANSKHGGEHPTIKSKCKNFNGTGSCSGCKFYPGGKTRAFDCRGFIYWILLMIYGWELMGGGTNSQWNNASNWKAKGEIATMPRNILCVLYVHKNGKKTHAGFGYKGETIECSSGVQHFTKMNIKWTHWAVPACVKEDVHPEPAPGPKPDPQNPMLKRGSSGEYVRLLQTILILLGYNLGLNPIDGKFGKKTEQAVKKFQKAHGLAADGIVGPLTWAELSKVEIGEVLQDEV